MSTRKNLFSNFDFRRLNSSDFKEDSVREELVLPILKELGYSGQQIVRSKSLSHPFVKIGSKKRQINIVPDYLLKIEDTYAWVLDAKAPTENILHGENVEQVFSYSMHPEIRTKFFALCNGKEFTLFRQDTQKPILHFQLRDIERNWDKLETFLSPASFHIGKSIVYPLPSAEKKSVQEFDYLSRPLPEEFPVRKQEAKRHFGVHGYFTKQSWNVVQEYIRNFTQAGDLVLDPFGGSGVTLIEALMTDRRAINIDLNPMSVFIVDALIAPVKISELTAAFDRVKKAFVEKKPTTKKEIKEALKKYPYPKGFTLPKGSDVKTVEDLFSEKQLAQLALLKSLILKEKDKDIRKSLLLAFSSSVNKFNLTFHYTKSEGGGDSGPFRYYRYRMAPDPGELELIDIFETKFRRVSSAKRDIESKINNSTIANANVIKGTATDLKNIKSKSVDYIYTDPPYGKKIPYLDLSVMWNAWLDLEVTEKDYQEEAIEGGEHNKSKEEYGDLIGKSIEEMYRVLKFDRWMSFVFAHKDPEFWHLIVDTAERAGFEYAGAVKQANGQTSFKKRQNPFTVLSGQLIINFKKVRKPKAILKANLGMKIGDIIMQTMEGIIAKHHGATLEQINDEIIIKGLELGFLDLLKKEYSDLTPLLLESFDFDEVTHLFSIKNNEKFKTHIDLNLRVRYYLISFLRRQKLERKQPTFDEIVLHIMPLLRNGITPEKQTILNVLEHIGERVGKDCWQLKQTGQGSLFL
ncbi:MAG: type I restriction enzyme HsdR N-terminal domain-containing protein [Ignavibacteriales bacterium]|nr:type I restriction enzyme HsdR N-terminal domain-containing protein [Ignavibacteriales bacterium]